MQFTIFTPTYNRAHTLTRLYKSLLLQSARDFEWLIVDDGSTDATKETVHKFVEEGIIPIRYLYQQNLGKHFAVNKGLKEASGTYFLVVDSDDYLLPEAMTVCTSLSEMVAQEPQTAGFSFIHFTKDIRYDADSYGKKTWYEQGYEWEHPGEMIYCYKTQIAKQFPFPEFRKEKFCPESLVHRRIVRSGYKILYTDHVLMSGEYLVGGLSSSFYQQLLNSPNASLLTFKEKIWDEKNTETRKEHARHFANIALQQPLRHGYKIITQLPISLAVSLMIEKSIRRLKIRSNNS